ncbi:MAG: glycosyltransferase [Planctomycetota bacterium]|jgi:UDP-N-acetylglucosamine transferase subunit ALG13
MILATVGTIPFPRLVRAMDEYAAATDEPVVVQGAGSAVTVRHADFRDYLPDLERWIGEARVVVLHGGVGTIQKVLAAAKPFVMVPRRGHLGEHYDDHQWIMLEKVASKLPGIVVDDISELPAAIEHCPQRWAEVSFESSRHRLIEALRSCVERLTGVAPPDA